MTSRYVIVRTPTQQRWRRILTGLLILLLAVTGYGLYQLGRVHTGDVNNYVYPRHQQKKTGLQSLLATTSRLKADKQRRVSRIAILESDLAVVKSRASSLQQKLAQAHDQLADLKEELAFYRGIVSPKNGEIGLHIKDISVQSVDENVYDLQLLLVRPMGYYGDISGQVTIQLHGVRQGETVSIRWPELALDSDTELVFSFQYYQQIGGVFRLPNGVQPTRIEVRFDVNNNGSEEVTRTFRWQDLEAASE